MSVSGGSGTNPQGPVNLSDIIARANNPPTSILSGSFLDRAAKSGISPELLAQLTSYLGPTSATTAQVEASGFGQDAIKNQSLYGNGTTDYQNALQSAPDRVALVNALKSAGYGDIADNLPLPNSNPSSANNFNPFLAASVLALPFAAGALGIGAAGAGATDAAAAGTAAAAAPATSGGLSGLFSGLTSLPSTISGGLSNILGGGTLGSIGSGAITGAGIGGLTTGITGGNILKGAELGGITGGIGGGISSIYDSAGGLSGIGDKLSSYFSGNPQGIGTFSPSAGVDLAESASAPSASVAGSAFPSGVSSAGAGAGGTAGGGFDLGTAGETIGAPSASGVGGSILDSSPLDSFNAGNAFDAVTAGGGIGSGVPIGASGDFASGTPSGSIPISGGNVGNANSILSSLPGGGTGGSSQLINGLLRSGLTGILNKPNNAGFDAQINAGNQVQQDYKPFLDSGTAANSQLSALNGIGGDAAQAAAQANFQNTPGYQFARDQGLQAVNANAAKMGQVLSGNNQQAVQKFGTGLADQTYNQYIQNLQNQAGQGVNAAGGVASGQVGAGNAQAGESGASANNQNSTVAGLISALFPQSGINFGANGLTSNSGNGLLSLFQ